MRRRAGIKTDLDFRERLIGIGSGVGILLLFGLFHIINIDGAVIAPGQVAVQGKARPVQSLEGGSIHRIHVRNGDSVVAGDVLLELDPTITQINRDIITGRLAELIARASRLEAEEQGADDILRPEFPPQLSDREVERHLVGQRQVFLSRRSVLETKNAQLEERILQHMAQIQGIEAQINAAESQVGFVAREVQNLETLHKQGLVPESRLLDLQGRQAALLGQIALHRSELIRTKNAIRDSELEIVQTVREFHEQVVTELREVTAKIEENRLELARIDNALQRLEVRAPVSGVVHEMQVWTTGGVIAPQETLLTVIPVADGVNFEVEVTPDAIDTIHLGQKARVRFPAFDQRTTPELNGVISLISPDSVRDPATGRTFYRVSVSLPEGELERLEGLELIPGMPIETFLQTGDRSVLSFLVKPFVDQVAHAFRES